MSIYGFILGSLAVWRISYLLTSESGPRDVFAMLRDRVAGNVWGGAMRCLYCMSLWIAAPMAWVLGTTVTECLLLWPALSAAAIIIERLVHRDGPSAPALYYEDKEE